MSTEGSDRTVNGEQQEEISTINNTISIESIDEDKRQRAMSQKAVQNAIQATSADLDTKEQVLKSTINKTCNALEKGTCLDVNAMTEPLQLAYMKYQETLEELEGLYGQDKWGDSSNSSQQIMESGKFLLRCALDILDRIKKQKEEIAEDTLSRRSKRTSYASSRTTSQPRSQASSASSARRKALAEAAAAKEKAEFDRKIAEMENERIRLEAEEDLQRKCARAQYERDMAFLAAERATAVADAKLKAIEQSIADEQMSVILEEHDSEDSRSRTQNWVNDQTDIPPNGDNVGDETHPADTIVPKHQGATGEKDIQVLPAAAPSNEQTTGEPPSIPSTNQPPPPPRGFAGNPPIFKPPAEGPTTSRKVEVLDTTNEKLVTSLVRQNLPKCHPDIFEGDPTLFHPWKNAFEAMIQDARLTPAQEMSYLRNYTAGKVQILVDNYRKRQQNNPSQTLQELWAELQRRFGNVAVITNSLLEKLRESAKFGAKDKVKLQGFADVCTDVENQMSYLPGLACLNYANAIRPIAENLPNFLRFKWEKVVVNHAEENDDEYPGFRKFTTVMKKQAKLRNHPNVAITEASDPTTSKTPERKRFHESNQRQHATRRVLKSEVKTGDNANRNDRPNEKHCTFHERKGHELSECKAFGEKTLEEKTEWIKKSGLCFRCLVGKHRASQCQAKIRCTKCNSDRHLSLLHKEREEKEQTQVGKTKEDGEELRQKCTSVCQGRTGGVSCSKIVLVDAFKKEQPNKPVRVYALMDDQSNASMISPNLIQKLNVDGPKERFLLSTCSTSKETKYGRRISGVVLRSTNGKTVELPTMLECEHIPQDKNEIPTPEMTKSFPHLKEIATEIPPLDHNAEIDILIGRDAPEVLKVRQFKNGPRGAPWAQKHILGWTISGEMCLDRVGGPVHISSHRTSVELSSEPLVDQSDCVHDRYTISAAETIPCPNYFQVKEQHNEAPTNDEVTKGLFDTTPEDNEASMSWDDRRFLEIMENAIHKNSSGNWEMPLPFRSPEIWMPNNRGQALDRLRSLQRTFRKKPQMEKDYVEFLGKMIERGHTVPVPSEEVKTPDDGNVWYLPHFAVYGAKKPDQIRVVFDSSCEYQGVSLNKVLIPGPDMMNSLVGVLMRFRKENVGVISDVEQMFHSFHVDPSHRDYLRFLWFKNNDTSQEVQEYRMNVHIFGNGPSPAVATFGLRKTALHGEQEFGTDVKDFVCRDFYVDDGLTSKHTEEEAIDLVKRAQAALATANLRLHKVASNSVAVVEAFDAEDRAKSVRELEIRQDALPSQRSLGVLWNMQTDTFTFGVNLQNKPFTRRGVLSVINSLYDPLGLAAPVILVGKLLLQQLTTLGKEKENNHPLGWDDPLPGELRRRWESWVEQLADLEEVTVPRCYHQKDFKPVKRTELHAFSDASMVAVATAVYLRQIDEKGEVSVAFVFGQAKVAPTQPTSIPRLELCAAVMSTQAVSKVMKELNLNIDGVTFYTDSKIVLGYIKNDARRFHVYVANRVQLIRNVSEPSQWRYVETTENPADIGSRGTTAKALAHSIWLDGPPKLRETSLDPPSVDEDEALFAENDPEVRKVVTVHATQQKKDTGLGVARFERASNWYRLQLAVARLIQRVRRCKKVKCPQQEPDTQERAKLLIIKTMQRETFAMEIELLEKKRETSKSVDGSKARARRDVLRRSNLYRLNPFLDRDGILRVGGRLHRSDLSLGEKHPILFPKNHHLTKLLIQHYHKKVHHQGRVITQGEIRQAGYWIVDGHKQVSKALRTCVTCRQLRGKCLTQEMADLPADRTETGAPFTNVGVDVFGPWVIKQRKLRGAPAEVKRWGLVFTCLASRAVHIEVLHSMDADSFICALRRFVAIRGPVSLIRCDCGTNFIGAKTELTKALEEMDKDRVEMFLKEQNCDWKFNPPHASHFGGVWERQIGTIRRVLDAMLLNIGSSQLDDELLSTLMAEASSIVNSRPITTISSDVDQPTPLTPSMLLTLKKRPVAPPAGKFVAQDMYTRRRWRRIQYLADQFWVRWKREYLQNLQKREKWNENERNLHNGDVVLMKDADLPRNEWPLAKVIDAIESEDQKVRKVKIQIFRDGIKKVFFRPISELILLVESEKE